MKSFVKLWSQWCDEGKPASRIVQLIFYIAAVGVLGLGIWLIPGVAQTRRELVFGILLLATVSLLLATMGSLSGIAAMLKKFLDRRPG
jgi:hypothetical protein